MDDIQKMKMRTILSAICYGIFVAAAVGAAIAHRADLRYYVMVPFILSYIFLPRRQFSPNKSEPGQESDSVKLARKVNLWLSYLRVIYLIVALFVLLGLPKII